MPEIAEVARVVHFLKKHIVGKTIKGVNALDDDIVYGKVGTSASAFKKAITGKKVVDARQQGKYFWLVLDTPPHPLFHFGMAGWLEIKNEETGYYRSAKPEKTEWPPKFWKFVLQMEEEPENEVAFVDARRLARIRLVDAAAEDMRKTTPLKENGPDPILDKSILTVEWLGKKLRSKKVPVKALLLDQANISGIGNWVGDEVMYQAKLHPEQYSNTFSDEQIKTLHEAIMYVCDTAVAANGDSDLFPEHWLMKHRWGKGKKEASKLPNGEKITFLKVGGRTSAIVPSVQKKTAAVAGDVSEKPKPKRGRKNTKGEVKVETEDAVVDELPARPKRQSKKVKEETDEEGGDEAEKVKPVKKQSTAKATKAKVKKEDQNEVTTETRRSGRLSK
ncbi:Nei Formamidopyrimidine-DNA glycosylase [Pyrenophora tritici-repentis]|nr:Formamidopyrimidine-DNA glycosylase [Pyrenophora tritici-repentis]KAF7453979.1 Formamidopyrimidine-DNA glycosylase [Pyrenophora tritici-repentis]KAI0573305.1 Formamidopyrimidine-DNA glycosylase [Pyrenophora tritici-repentis]KAI0573402.1 Formamidopyrimidine-DNA glycosylase [Pyrenophora tritici-repentis]KAI0605661.1 Formamidopyrimidine-DNA glycosylase [Pyrenophora tritici-repentis]